MANCSDLSIREISGGTVYIQGTITGLSNHKEYCLKYYDGNGIYRNVLTRNLTYTYTRNVTSLNAGSLDCCIPESAYTDAGKYYLGMYEVVSRCENVVEQVCDKYLEEAAVEVLADFRVSDRDGTGVAGARVSIPTALRATTITTNYMGVAEGFALEAGKSHTASVTYLPNAWETTGDSTLTFTPQYNQSFTLYVKAKSTAPTQHGAYFWVRDENGNPVNHAKIECAGESFYTDVAGKVVRTYDAGYKYYAQCHAPTGYECTDCYKSFYLDSYKHINFYMKAAAEEIPAPKDECKEGTYTADRKRICRGGVWVAVTEEPEVPVVPGVGKYLTVAEADERVRMGLPCYIKCTLPILDMLPGLPYTPGAWVPPFCAITTEP